MLLANKKILITGASRGIGREMALLFAHHGACIGVAAKTSEPNPKLPGTIHSVVDEIKQAGGKAVAIQLDVRDENQIEQAIITMQRKFGGIDILINNASAIMLTNTENTPAKRFDLMQQVNVRGTFLCAQYALPCLKQSDNPHILTLSPPISIDPKWFKNHLAYTLSKYGMSMCTLGMAAEFKPFGIAVNSLWPKTTIATSAIKNLLPDAIYQASRYPSIVADAALAILQQESRNVTGQFFIDEDVLREAGTTDFSRYSLNKNVEPYPDLFLEKN